MSKDMVYTTAQGATCRGQSAKDPEAGIWTFCTFLREALYAFPLDATKEEYHEYVIGLADVFRVCVH